MHNTVVKKGLAILLSVLMVFGSVPQSAYADYGDSTAPTTEFTVQETDPTQPDATIDVEKDVDKEAVTPTSEAAATPVEETTQVPPVEESTEATETPTTEAAVEETTEAAPVEESTEEKVEETTQAQPVEETTQAPEEEAETQPVEETTEAVPVEETTEAAPVEETGEAIPVEETGEAVPAEESTQAPEEETTQAQPEEETTEAAQKDATEERVPLNRIDIPHKKESQPTPTKLRAPLLRGATRGAGLAIESYDWDALYNRLAAAYPQVFFHTTIRMESGTFESQGLRFYFGHPDNWTNHPVVPTRQSVSGNYKEYWGNDCVDMGSYFSNERFTVDGEIAYCFDHLTKATINDVTVSSSMGEASIYAAIGEEMVMNLARAAKALTDNNFELIRLKANDIAKSFTHTATGRTIPKDQVVALLQSTSADAIAFKRGLVQSMIWQYMNQELARTANTNIYAPNGFYDKQGNWYEGRDAYLGEVIGIGTIIPKENLYNVGLDYYHEYSDEYSNTWQKEYPLEVGKPYTVPAGDVGNVRKILADPKNGGKIEPNGTVTVNDNGTTITLTATQPIPNWTAWRDTEIQDNAIYSSKPYREMESGQFIVKVDEIQKLKVRVKAVGEAKLSITKTSANPSYTNGNAMYTLAGIQYGIYSDAACRTLVTTVTLNAEGTAPAVTLQQPGTYYVQEIHASVAGSGYRWNDDIKPVTVAAGESKSVDFTDEPITDPRRMTVRKVDMEGKEITGADLSGAQFTVKYYDSIFTNAASAPQTAKQTWIYETKANGSLDFSDRTALVSGEFALAFPLGTLVVTETKAPTNFNKTADIWTVTIQQDTTDTGRTAVTIYKNGTQVQRVVGDQTAIDPILVNEPAYMSATLKKVDQNGNPIQGVKFKLTGAGIPANQEEKTTDASGVITWTGIPWKQAGVKATLTETYVPEGYEMDPDYANGKSVTITGAPESTYNLGTIKNTALVNATLKKVDAKGSPVAGIKFNLVYDGKDHLVTTGTDGKVTWTGIPNGTKATIIEVEAEGYVIDPEYAAPGKAVTITANVNETYDLGQIKNTPARGGVKFSKIDADRNLNVPSGDATLKDAEITIYAAEAIKDVQNAKNYKADEAVLVIKTDAEGNSTTAIDALPFGKYYAKETKASVGYLLNSEWKKEFTIEVANEIVDKTDEPIPEPTTDEWIFISKTDADMGGTVHGDAGVKDIKFAIVNRSANAVVYGSKTYESGRVIVVLATDENGQFKTEKLPYGTYDVYELRVDATIADGDLYDTSSKLGNSIYANTNGYLFNPNRKNIVAHEHNKTYSCDFTDEVVRGGISVEKKDARIEEGFEGDASPEGIRFAIVNKSAQKVYVGGTEYAPGAVVDILTLDAEGKAATANNTLPYGTYEVFELRADATIAVGDVYGEQASKLGTSVYANDKGYLFKDNHDEMVVRVNKETYKATFENESVPGGAGLTKNDADTKANEAQGDASLEGIEYAIVNRSKNNVLYGDKEYAPGEVIMIVKTDKEGKFSTAKDELRYGTYDVIELSLNHQVKVGTKYAASQNGKSVYANANGYLYQAQTKQLVLRENEKMYPCDFTDEVVRGGVSFTKVDAEKEVYDGPELSKGQGDTTLKDAEITIYNESKLSVWLDGKEYKPGSIVKVLKTDNNGIAKTGATELPYGTYRAVETKASKGYHLNEDWEVIFQIREQGVVLDTTDVSMKGADKTTVLEYTSGERMLENGKLPEEPIRGGVSFEKFDAETGKAEPQGDATLAGAEIGIYNVSGREVYVVNENGEANWVPATSAKADRDALIASGSKVISLFTDENGKVSTDARALPYGTYKAVEIAPSNGYLTNDTWYVIFQIREDGVVVKTADKNFYKADGKNTEKSCYYEYSTGAGYGSITRQASDGRLLEEIKRNDLTWEKLNIDGITKARIPFALDRLEMIDGKWTVVETHVIVSDADGIVNTGAAFTDRSRANSLDKYVKDGVFSPDSALDPTVGVWFGETMEGATSDRGALIYGTYRIRELACLDNQLNHEDLLVSDLIYIHDDYEMNGKVEDTSKPIQLLPQNPRVFGYHALIDLEVELSSLALDTESRTHSVPSRESVSVVDKIHYTHLKETSKYRMEVTLMVTDTAIEIGKYSLEFSPERSATSPLVKTAEGDVEITCTFDSRPYEGKKIASVVRLYEIMNDANGEYEVLIHTHNTDHKDVEQEIAVPTMITNAIDAATGDHVGAKRPNKESGAKTVIRDTVELRYLAPQEQYMLVGKLVNRLTGEVIAEEHQFVFTSRRSSDNNQKIHYSEMTGSYMITMPAFEIDASAFEEMTLVVYETLYRCATTNNGQTPIILGDPILVHESAIGTTKYDPQAATEFYTHNGQLDDNRDPSRWYMNQIDEAQSVHFVEVRTTATDGDTADHVGTVKEDAVIYDEVVMTNLIPGMTYTIKGAPHYQEDFTDAKGVSHKAGEAVPYKEGSVAELTFTATKADEKKVLSFIVDSTLLEGTTVVAYEDLYHNGVLIAWHNDLTDEEQSVHYPKIRTSAADKLTGDDVGAVGEKATIIDTVKYENLIVGERYTITGKLMDQTTGKALLIDGKEVTATTGEFTATEKNGSIALTFTFDASKLGGTTVVVFEKLFHPNAETGKPVEVANHEDINDDAQTVHFPEIWTNASDGKTGDEVGTVATETTIIDMVKYENLRVGRTYTVSGVVHQRNNETGEDMGELLDSNGERITATYTFVAGQTNEFVTITAMNESDNAELINNDADTDRVDGYVKLVFTFDGSKFADDEYGGSKTGVTGVVFEELIHEGITVAVHADINDEAQTIHYPKIRTNAADALTKDEVGAVREDDRLIDTVSYWNLVPGKEYSISGMLMNKDTGKEVLVGGKTVTKSAAFVDETPNGSIDLEFAVNAKDLAGMTVVVFEKLWHNDVVVTVHEDLTDHDQTIHYPDITTDAYDGKTEDHVGTVEKTATIIDKVSFTDLVKGMEYTLNGAVHIRTADGKDGGILEGLDGEPITATATFIAGDESDTNMVITLEEEVNGRIRVSGYYLLTFKLDSTLLQGETVVVFEELLHNDVVVEVHADINDEDQAVHYPEIKTNAVDESTGDHVGNIFGRFINWIKHIFGETDADGNGIADDVQQNVIDRVTLENLVIGREYTISGKLMNKDTGEALLIDGEEITQSATIRVTENGKIELVSGNAFNFKVTKFDKEHNFINGSIELRFSFDSSKLENRGTTIVVFEDLIFKGITVNVHHDINDEAQSINEVEIRTNAIDKATGGKVGTVPSGANGGQSTIKDRIEFYKLVEGMNYRVEVILVDQAASSEGQIVYLLGKDGQKLTKSVEFTPADLIDAESDGFSASGHMFVSITVDNELVQGKAITVFENLYHNDLLIASHPLRGENGQPVWNSEEVRSQTVYYPTGKTNATDDKTTVHLSDATEDVTITDAVYFENFIEGKEYTVKGQLMNKDTGLSVEGAVSEVTFVAAEEIENAYSVVVTTAADGTKLISGYMPLTFTVDASLLAGKTLVTFEDFLHEGVTIFVHADFEDLPQTIRIPEIKTSAQTGILDETAIRDASGNYKDFTIVDTVSYKNLWTQAELDEMARQGKLILDGAVKSVREGDIYTIEEKAVYTVIGYLMDKHTGAMLLDDAGNPVLATSTFTPEASDGTVEVVFTLNAKNFMDEETGESRLEGMSLVVFEDLYHGEVTDPAAPNSDDHIAEHHDITDPAQDIRLPKGRTHAQGEPADNSDEHAGKEAAKDHEVLAAKDMTITDVVTYENLHGGTEYTVTGRLMDKATGLPMLDDNGVEITATETFVTEGNFDDEVSGSVVITFRFDGITLAGKTTVAFETITREGQDVIVHADLNDDAQMVHIPEIETNAYAANTPEDFHEALAAKDELVTIYDTVTYHNLRSGFKYTVTGILMDQETGEPILVDGKEVTATRTFIAGQLDGPVDHIQDEKAGVEKGNGIVIDGWNYEGISGVITLTFTFDASALEGKTVVAFEDLYNDGKLVAIHHDIEDESQSVHFPKVRTTAVDDETKLHEMLNKETATVVDIVKYENLHVGKEYEVRGTLMLKSTGKVLVVDGKEVTASLTFVPETENGEVELRFEFDASALKGETVVAFEKLYRDDLLVGVHADINDEDQSVHIPEITTEALADETKDHIAPVSEEVVIRDEVFYKNVIPGHTYKVSGVLMVKETGEALLIDGKELVAEAEFVAEEENGSIVLTFPGFDSKLLEGQTVVVFETMYVDEYAVAVHADIEDEEQSVHVPKVTTEAKDAATGDHDGHLDKMMTIIDEVFYENLLPGKTYTVSGTLMVKETGLPLVVDGKTITSTKEFVAEEANGSIDLEFVFDSSALAGKTLVAFETLEYQGITVGVHADIEDEDQSVYVPEIGTKARDKASGTQTMTLGSNTVLVDTVSYKNLTPGKEYTLKGELMDQHTGKATGIKAEAKFVAEAAEGTTTVEFVFNTEQYYGKHLVAFEWLFDAKGNLLAEHADVNDPEQIVYVPVPTPPVTPPDTGDFTDAQTFTLMLALSLAALAAVIMKKRREEKGRKRA